MIKEILSRVDFGAFFYRIADWHLKYLLGLNVFPLSCGFYITSKCNFKCEFCNIRRITPHHQVSYDMGKNIIKQLGKMGVIYFSFSGGEPLLVPYVFNLLRYAKKYGILYTHIVSNGFLMDEILAKETGLANVSEISFSIDGPEQFHDRVRGVGGAFQKVLSAVDHIKTHAPQTKVVLNSVLLPHHPEYAIQAMKTARLLGVKIKVQPVNDHPEFGARKSAEKWNRDFGPEQIKNLLDVIETLKKSPIVVNSNSFFENYKSFLFSPKSLVFFNKSCIYGKHHMEIFDERLYPCLEGMKWKNGFDLHSESLTDVILSSAYMNKLNYLKQCSGCQKSFYVCYYEPRLNFPIWNFLSSRVHPNIDHDEVNQS
jgi:MoaA/NifB/PqqE/SkfB family radical SAM enzyme